MSFAAIPGLGADALMRLQGVAAKGSPTAAGAPANSKARTAAEDFEAVFLGAMFKQMFTGIDGEGPFGGTQGVGVWRSFLTDQYAKAFAKAGGVGIAPHVYDTLLRHQGARAP